MLTTNQRFAFFYFMERYIFIRDCFLKREGDSDVVISKGCKLHLDNTEWSLFLDNGKDCSAEVGLSLVDKFDEMRICLMAIDPDLFKTAFQSFAYANWMKEKAADIDDQGNPLYPTLTRTPETLIMYLMELGISSDTLMRYTYGPENKYLEYKYLVQEFGKML